MRSATPPPPTSKRRRSLRVRLAATSALLAAAPALAQVAPDALPRVPDQPLLVSTAGNVMTVTPVNPRTVINWNSYDIGSAATVQYVNAAGIPVAPIAVLNRVSGVPTRAGPTTITESNILGTLTSADNIAVYLVNQAGILFGPGAKVSVGSLIASTRDISDNSFIAGVLRFTGSSTAPDPAALVLNGSQTVTAGSTDPTGFRAKAGIVGLIAAKIVTTGTINAAKEVALVAANDTTLALSDGSSPLRVTIIEGSALSAPMVLRGALNGSSILLAAATRNDVTDGLLDVQAALTATSAYATDQGIVLAAGRTDSLNDSIDMPAFEGSESPPSQNNGLVALRLGGTLTATGAAGAIDVRANNGIGAPPAPGAAATLDADGAILVQSDFGGMVLGNVTSRLASPTDESVALYAADGAITAGNVAAGAIASVIADDGAVTLASLRASGAATVSGTSVQGGSLASDTATLDVTATAGSIAATSLAAGGALTATATGDASVGNATAGGSATFDIGGNLTSSGTIRSTAGAVGITAGRTGLGNVNAATTLNVTTRTGPLVLATGTAGTTASLRAATSAQVGAVTASNIGVSANGQITAASLNATGTALPANQRNVTVSGTQVTLNGAQADNAISVFGGRITLGGDQRAGGTALYRAAGDPTNGTITASATGFTIRGDANGTGAGGILLDAERGINLAGVALVTGSVTSPTATGTIGINLGTLSAPLTLGSVTSRALRSVDFYYTPATSLTTDGPVTLGPTSLIDAFTLNTSGPIVLSSLAVTGAGQRLVINGTSNVSTGANASVAASGRLFGAGGVLVTAPAAVSLADVDGGTGRADLVSVNATLGAGAVSGVGVDARARGALTLGSVASSGAAVLTSATSTLDVTGATRATGTVTVDAPGAITMGDVRSTGDTALFQSSNAPATGAIRAGNVQAFGDLTVARAAGLTFASATSDTGAVSLTATPAAVSVTGAVTARTSVAVTGGSVALGSVLADTGTATLTAGAGGIAVGGGTVAQGIVTLVSPGAITLGDVRSRADTVDVRPTAAADPGAVTAGNVRAATSLSVTRAAAISLGSARADTGAVSLTSSGYAVGVSGPTVAGTDVTVDGATVSLGDVTAGSPTVGGAITLTARSGTLTAGTLTASNAITVSGPGGVTLGGGSTTGGTVALTGATLAVTGPLTAPGNIQATTTGAASIGDVTATNGSVALTVGGSLSGGTLRAGDYVTVSAGGDLDLRGAESANSRVDLATGDTGRITVTGAIASNNFVSVDAGTNAQLASVTDTGAGPSLLRARNGALTIGGAVSVGGPLAATATGDLRAGAVTSTGGAVTLTSGAALEAGAVDANGALAVTGGTSLTLASARSGTAGVVLTSPGAVFVAGSTTARGDVSVSATGVGTIALGDVTSDVGAVALSAANGAVGARVVSADGALSVTGPAGVTLASARSLRSNVTLSAAAGPLTVSGLTRAGGNVAITARDAIALGAALGGSAPEAVDVGGQLTVSGGSVTLANGARVTGDAALSATAGDLQADRVNTGGALSLTSSGATTVTGAVSAGGSYRVDAARITLGAAGATSRQSAADVTLSARTGAITVQGPTTLAGNRTVTLTARGANGSVTLAPESIVSSTAGDVTVATTGAAALGTVTASAGAIGVEAADASLTRPLTAQAVTLANAATAGITRVGDAPIGNEGEFAAPATRFDLSNAEVNLIAAPSVTIASGARDVVTGAVTLGSSTGSTRFAIGSDGRIDMLGRFLAPGSTASRTIAIGSAQTASAPRTTVIRLAATQANGGRIIVDGAALELSADRIGGGLDRDFLDAIGYRSTPGLSVDQVNRDYVARPTSTLYRPSALGAAPYTDQLLVRAGTLSLTYGKYALFQNTGLPGREAGVEIGASLAPAGPALRLATPGSASNTFAFFGTISGISSSAAALLGPDRVAVDGSVSPTASRVNGCIIGTGAGCINTSIAQPSLNLFDTSRAEIVRTADDLTLPFDPLVGTNNEALYLDPAADQTAPDCEGDTPCPTKP